MIAHNRRGFALFTTDRLRGLIFLPASRFCNWLPIKAYHRIRELGSSQVTCDVPYVRSEPF